MMVGSLLCAHALPPSASATSSPYNAVLFRMSPLLFLPAAWRRGFPGKPPPASRPPPQARAVPQRGIRYAADFRGHVGMADPDRACAIGDHRPVSWLGSGA